MNETQMEIALGLVQPFEARLTEDEVWEVRPLNREVVGRGKSFAEAVMDLVDKWPKA
jgi:hypothetical protein